MATGLFTPKDVKSQWRIVFDHLTTLAVNDVVSYNKLAELLPGLDRGQLQGCARTATKHLRREYPRTLANVRNVGYRVVDAPEHEGLAKEHNRRARRQLKTGLEILSATDRTRISYSDRARIDAMELHQKRLANTLDEGMRRLGRTERALQEIRETVKTQHRATKADVAQISDALAKLQEQMKRAGIPVDTSE